MTSAMLNKKNKIVVILGPTSSGKSDVAISLAQKLALSKIEGFDGAEIVSADSRQIYRGMDIGSGKVTKEEQGLAKHWMLDIVSPKTNFSAGQYKKKVNRIIKDILKRGKLPIICGGTGFWIKSIVDNVEFPEVKPDWVLRKKLEKETAEKLFSMLEKLDSARAENIDAKNKVRLIRAIEIAKTLGCVPEVISSPQYVALQIGISMPKEKLHERIEKRLDKRFAAGMLDEVANLHTQGVSWKRLESFGLEYKWLALFLQGKISEIEMKDNRIIWIETYKDIEKEIADFIKV